MRAVLTELSPPAMARAQVMLRERSAPGPSGCLVWTGTFASNGYGVATVAGRQWKAHRLSYVVAKGRIPADLVLDHLCRRKACINPEHLEPVQNGENVLRGESFSARNRRRTHCVHGHKLTGANLYRQGRRRRCRACLRRRGRAYEKAHPERRLKGRGTNRPVRFGATPGGAEVWATPRALGVSSRG